MAGTVFELLSRSRATLEGRLVLVCAGIGAGAAGGSVAAAILPLVLPVHPEVLPQLPGWLTLTGFFLGALLGTASVGFRRAVPPATAVTIAIVAKSLLGFGSSLDSGEWLRLVVPPLACIFAIAAAFPAPRPGEGGEFKGWWSSMRGLPAPRQP